MSITNFFNEIIMKENEDRMLLRKKELEHSFHEKESAQWAASEISNVLVYDYGVPEHVGNTIFDLLSESLVNRTSSEHEALVRSLRKG